MLAKPPASASPLSLALLSVLQPEHSQLVSYAHTQFRRSRRLIQLRRGVLILFKTTTDTDLDNVDKTYVLSNELAIRASGANALRIGKRDRLYFDHKPLRDAWLARLNSAQAGHDNSASRYQVQCEMGHGASGTVYLVRDKIDAKQYALKVVEKAVSRQDNQLKHMVAERIALETAANQHSPFIIRLVDAFQTETNLCFVTELAAYRDLRHVMDRLPAARFPAAIARKLFAQIVLGLEDTHRMGYLYRDMKLGNVLLNAEGHIRVADFGLAKRLAVEWTGASGESSCTEDEGCDDDAFRLVGRTNSFVGTQRYMSPEHVRGGDGYGAPADFWALGVTLFMMLVGKHPVAEDVHAQNIVSLHYCIANEDVQYPDWMDEDAVSLLKGLLCRDASQRFGFAEVKSHPWLARVNWAQLKHDSLHHVKQDDVLALLDEAQIRTIEEINRGRKLKYDSAAILNGSQQMRRRGRHWGSSYNLLGFRYSAKDERESFSGLWSDVSVAQS